MEEEGENGKRKWQREEKGQEESQEEEGYGELKLYYSLDEMITIMLKFIVLMYKMSSPNYHQSVNNSPHLSLYHL